MTSDTPRSPRVRFYIHDRAKGQASELTRFSHLNPRFSIVDRVTGSTVDEAQSMYEARQALSLIQTPLKPTNPTVTGV